jgi:hypothetical protein
MTNLLRYLLSFGVHLIWQRTGRSGPVPPLRLPFGKNKGRLMPLPVIASWQIVAVLWLSKKIWVRYGDDIQQRLDQSKGALLDRVDRLIAGHSKSAASQKTTPTTAIPPRPSQQYHTLPLPDEAHEPSTPSTPLPSGSVLSGLRGTH